MSNRKSNQKICDLYKNKSKDTFTSKYFEEWNKNRDEYLKLYEDFCNKEFSCNDNESLYRVIEAWENIEKDKFPIEIYDKKQNKIGEIGCPAEMPDLEFLKDIGIDLLNPCQNQGGKANQKWHLYVAIFAYSVVCKKTFDWGADFRAWPCLVLRLWMIENADNQKDALKEIKTAFDKADTGTNELINKAFIVLLEGMYIVARRILNKKTNNRYYLKLNRESRCLKIYKKTKPTALWDNYPIKQDFDALDYVMYELAKIMPCIFGGAGKTQTPAGIFNIEKRSASEYISPYHPKFDQVKFFGYLVVFEDYFIHSDMYSMDVNIADFHEKESISLHDKHTSGCIRVSQEDLYWLMKRIPEGTTVEM